MLSRVRRKSPCGRVNEKLMPKKPFCGCDLMRLMSSGVASDACCATAEETKAAVAASMKISRRNCKYIIELCEENYTNFPVFYLCISRSAPQNEFAGEKLRSLLLTPHQIQHCGSGLLRVVIFLRKQELYLAEKLGYDVGRADIVGFRAEIRYNAMPQNRRCSTARMSSISGVNFPYSTARVFAPEN